VRWCVFCGSSPGTDPRFVAVATELGTRLAQAGIGIVFGGGRVGLMGAVADAALAAGGNVIGVIPAMLAEREVAHEGLTELHIVASMHERKALMNELSDGFIMLPGGFGTFEEFCEVVTWVQLRIIDKPCVALNIAGYYDPLLAMFDSANAAGFINNANRSIVQRASSVEEILTVFRLARPIDP
jgi:uncharacterized protein (TIGR00730 family)